ncbi:hypothetical protein BD309DRAFT_384508 [Dichomitus squalens]|nr:hypothetical protein BD309DRAFT_384508 [Dichomitus squalens]
MAGGGAIAAASNRRKNLAGPSGWVCLLSFACLICIRASVLRVVSDTMSFSGRPACERQSLRDRYLRLARWFVVW